MNPLSEVQLVTRRELGKSLRSAKGAILAALTVAGGGGAAMLFAWLDRMWRTHLPPGMTVREVREQLFTQIYGAETARSLADAPYALWMTLIASLWLGPLLVALMNFDSVSGELQHRTVRYWAVRTRRSSFLVGKYLGAWLVVLAVTLGMNVIVWIATVAVGDLPMSSVVSWGVRFFAVTVPISAAWCGIATVVGSQCKTPVIALLTICATFFGLWLLYAISLRSGVEWLSYVYPNSYDHLLLSPRPADLARGVLGTCAIAAATAAAAAVLFELRDL